jgi:hypothetical protein
VPREGRATRKGAFLNHAKGYGNDRVQLP